MGARTAFPEVFSCSLWRGGKGFFFSETPHAKGMRGEQGVGRTGIRNRHACRGRDYLLGTHAEGGITCSDAAHD